MNKYLFNIIVSLTLLTGLYGQQLQAFSSDVEFIPVSENRILANSSVNELVILDATVPDKQMFYQQNKAGVKIVEIHANQDGLMQFSNILKNYHDLDTLHVVSHASDGVIYLGTSQITEQLLQENNDIYATLDHALKDGADILFYGCELAKSEQGKQLLQQIASQANINVAASSNLTGNPELGGDWELDVSIGNIDSMKFWSTELENQYLHVLAIPVFNTTPEITNISPGGGTLTVELNLLGGANYVVLPDGASAPSNVQVQSGTDGSGNTAIINHSTDDSNPANIVFTAVISGLSSETSYDVYVTGYDENEADRSGVNDTEPVKIDLITSALGDAPDGDQTFSDISIINNIGQTNDGYFNLIRLDGSGSDSDLKADQYGAYIDDSNTASSSFTSSIKINMTVPGYFQITDITLGEYQTGSLVAANNFIDIQVVGYKDGVTVAQSTPYTPPSDTYITDYTSISWTGFSDVNIDEFEVFYTVTTGDKQNEFNLIGFSISDMNTVTNVIPAITIDNTNLSYTENATATQIDSAATLTDDDGDADWDSGTLVVQITSNNEAGDELSIEDNIVGSINSSGTNILDSLTVIGTLSASEGTVTNGTALTITFNSNATNILVEQVLQAISYRSRSDDPGTSNRMVIFTATDKNSASANDSRTIIFTALNDQPRLSVTRSNPTFTEGGAAAGIFSSATVSTVELGQTLTALTLTVTNVNDGSNEILLIDGTAVTLTHGTSGMTASNSASYWVSVSGGTATVTLSGMTTSTAALQTLVDGTAYQNNSQNPNTSNRVITFTSLTDSGNNTGLNDNINSTLAGASTITVIAVNDAPSDITLSAVSINQVLTTLGANIGTLSSTDLDDSSFTYTLVSNGSAANGTCGVGNDADNADFQINTATLETTGFLASGSYKICIQSDDGDTAFEEAFTITVVDDVAPTIMVVNIPNSAHKVGDTVTAMITVSTDSDDYSMGSGSINGTINGYALGSLSKVNDTTYSATFTITDGGTDVAAGSNVAVNFTLDDSVGNSSTAFTTAINQSSDVLYANLPQVSLTVDTNSIAEGGGVSTLTATISGSLNNQWPDDITVSLAYTGTGTAGTDYSKVDSITIIAGSSSANASIISVADSMFDAPSDESVIVDISSLSAGNEGSVSQKMVTIMDAQSAPTVTLSTGNSTVAENAGRSMITATLSNATYADVTVNLSYAGTATSGGVDYNTASSSITIPAGSTSASAVAGITAVDDAVLEGDETIIIDIVSVSGGSAAENGSQQLILTISDDAANSDDDAANSAPVISGSPAVTITQDHAYSFKATAIDADQDSLTYSIKNLPVWAEFKTVTGELSGTPAAEHIGITSGIIISVSDGTASASLAAFNIEVIKVNKAPQAEGSSISLNEDSSAIIKLTATDSHQDLLSYVIENQPEHGSLVKQGDTWLYTPNADFNGDDSFNFKANDGEFDSNSATVSIDVLPINDKPIAVDDLLTLTANADNRYQIDLLANDFDADGDKLNIIGISASAGEAIIENGQLVYQALDGTAGKVEFSYIIQDTSLERASAKATLIINSVANDNLPVLTVPADIVVNATGLFTKVEVGIATAVDKSGKAIPVSIVNGDTIFPPGNNTVHWQAVDAEGNILILSQKVKVQPLVSIDKDSQLVEGSDSLIEVHLNGEAPDYPVLISYSVSGSADAADHNLSDGQIIIEQGISGFIHLSIYEDGESEGNETIKIKLSAEHNLGYKSEHVITIVEGNVAPRVEVQVSQATELRNLVTNNDELVTVSAFVSDVNLYDSHNIIWTTENNSIVDLSVEAEKFIFNPSALLPGIYKVTVIVADDATEPLSTTQTVYIEVTLALAVLGDEDTDGDLIPDNIEGFKDSDSDGIPDYLDAINECNVLQERALQSDKFLVEGEPGVCLHKGASVTGNQTGGVQILTSELPSDDDMENIGGLFDFIATGLAIPGQNYTVVFPQRLPVPEGAVYRKLQNSQWSNFIEDENNKISSTSGEFGYCPPPNNDKWSPGLTAGHWCVQLTIQDGGPNDDDGLVNSSIVDPGGVAVRLNNNQLPVANPDIAIVKWNKSITIDVLANDTDADNDIIEISDATVDFGELTIENSQIVYTTSTVFFDKATIQYSITDNNGGSAHSSVTVQVVNNFAPIANDDSTSTNDKTSIKIMVLNNDQDEDGDELTITQASALYGSVVINSDQTLTYTAQLGFNGVDIITYSIMDEQSATAQGKVMVTVKAYVTTVIENTSGGGSMGGIAILLLAVLVILRRYKKVSLLLALTAISSNLTANTQTDNAPPAEINPWSIEATLGGSFAHNNSALNDISSAQVKSVDDSDIAWSMGIAYHFNQDWKLAIRYIDLGQGQATLSTDSLNPEEYHQAVAKVMPVLGHGIGLDVSYQLFNIGNFFTDSTLGLFNWRSELDSRYQNNTISHDESGSDLYLGLLLGYKFNQQWELGVGYTRYFISQNDVDNVSLKLSYRL